MNQQQLQNARTALWRQNGQPLLTGDDAAAWLEETAICLFLPRHAQLPAPAPSFVEACAGEGRAIPAPAAIDAAMALATRLVAEGRAVPLNLMGNLTEQPDFLVTPEVLRWVASVRGDRNWKAAPPGRTAPLVQRVWEALDRAPGRTEPEIREELGRELTEAAVLRALVELWTTLRAGPEYAAGEPTRWSLMKDRYPREMAAGANTAQTTALSALISFYLRQAVAATAEEAEIFLSPLTARSRIREVLHGMLATRQFGTIAMGVNTLLYLEGTLPEMAEEQPAEAPPAPAEAPVPARPHGERPEGAPERKPWSRPRPEPGRGSRPAFRSQPRREFSRESQRPFTRGPKREGQPERGKRREFERGKKPPFRPGQKLEWKRPSKPGPGSASGLEPRRTFSKPGGKPWEKRREFPEKRTQNRQGTEFGGRREGGFHREQKAGGWQAPQRPERESGQREEGRPATPREGRSGARGGFGKKPWQSGRPQRENRGARQGGGDFRRGANQARQNRGEGGRESRPGIRPENREPGKVRGGFRRESGAARGAKPFAGKPKFGGQPGRTASGDRRPGGFSEKSGKRFGKPGAESGKPGGRFGKPGGTFGKSGAKFGKPGGRFGKPSGKFAKPGEARENRPWKNRPDKNGPKGPRSGKNRKGPEDQPE